MIILTSFDLGCIIGIFIFANALWVWAVLYSSRFSFKKGLKWAEQNSPRKWTDGSLKSAFQSGKRNPNIKTEDWFKSL